ncbi:STAS domain-containing protein [Polyangium spumosum]|uniref:PAS domain-containing protein n=1 Tax=Polyangium spumosum TaxID=889282 RepID=A0A6N7PXQ2_9BACT|nr:STAS domain-containing protein [Polyangium spumosum]MRG96669.1 PAS domain-containing protein [Polyangium spumosum]
MRMDLPPAETLLRGCPTPLALVSSSGEALVTNAAWEARVGGGALDTRVHEEDRSALAAARARALGGEATQGIDVRLARGGHERARLSFWRADAQTLWASAEAYRDEEEERKARILNDCFRVMEANIWSCDTEGKILVSDGKGLALLGLVPGQMVGMNIFDAYPPGSAAHAVVKRTLDGESFFYEDVSEKAHWLNVYTPRLDASGVVEGLQSISVNFGANLQLSKKSKVLADCVDRLPICIWAFDESGSCTLLAGALGARLGVSAELVGKDLFEVYGDRPDFVADMKRALAGEEHIVERDLGDVHIRTRFVPIHDPFGEIIGACAATEDATEQHLFQVKLTEQLALIESQKQAIAELGTPIIEVWQDVLVVPVVGALDAARAEQMLEVLLEAVVHRQARFVILDLTGVEAVDASTAEHLVRVAAAVRLLGCEGIITGIRPSVAETIVGLGVDLSQTRTLRSLKDALRFCTGDSARRRAR